MFTKIKLSPLEGFENLNDDAQLCHNDSLAKILHS
jgi:hypothetical protein